MNQVERAVTCFQEGFSCAQSVLSAYGPEMGLDRERCLKVAGAFGAGMGRMGQTCGAVTGALMAIGLKTGKTQSEDDQANERAYGLVQEFAHEFELRNGSITCNELLGCDMSTPEGRAVATEKGLFSTLCPKLVRDAVEILEQIL